MLRTSAMLLAALVGWFGLSQPLSAADQGQVNAAIQKGSGYLHGKLKATAGPTKSLAAYALVKTGSNKNDPLIQEAVGIAAGEVENYAVGGSLSGRENGFGHKEFAYTIPCHMFLLEAVDPVLYKPQLEAMAAFLCAHQHTSGSWFYVDPPSDNAGDTSQTQFAMLGLWAAQRAGVDVPGEVWQKAAQWLLKVQRDDGGFAYQPASQVAAERETKLSNTLASMACLLITRQVFYPGTQFGEDVAEMTVQKKKKFGVLDRLQDEQERQKRSGRISISTATLDKAIARSLRVVDSRFRITQEVEWDFLTYIFYSMERTAALLDSEKLGKHDWYERVSDEIIKLQLSDGSWSDRSGSIPATSFAILTLNRTTAKLLNNTPAAKKVGGGLLAGARGLPDDLAKMQLKDGQAVERKIKGGVDELLNELEKVQDVSVADVQKAILDSVNLDDPDELVGQLDRLKRLAKDPRVEVRRTAFWAIGRTGEIRLAPLLIAGLKDDDVDVVREASFGLTVLSRKPTGLTDAQGKTVPVEPLEGVDEDATEEQQAELLKKWQASAEKAWKNWYLSVRPYEERDDRQQLKKKS